MTTTVRIDKSEDREIWTVTIDRPEGRNAVDGPTARALADAFRAFEADASARDGIGVEGAKGIGEGARRRPVDGVAHLGTIDRHGPDFAGRVDANGRHGCTCARSEGRASVFLGLVRSLFAGCLATKQLPARRGKGS